MPDFIVQSPFTPMLKSMFQPSLQSNLQPTPQSVFLRRASARPVVAMALVTLLTACGGGGSEEATTTPTTPAGTLVRGNGYTVNEVPLQTTYVAPPYAAGSLEAGVFAHANKLRSECGFGNMTSDPKLDQVADLHARYMTVQAGNLGSSGHRQENQANPWFRGSMPNDRAIAAGYQDSYHVSEGLSAYRAIDPNMDAKLVNLGLMNAPYHALDLLAPRLNFGVGAQWSTKMGLPNTFPYPVGQWGGVVSNYGTTSTNGNPNVQTLPTADVLTWPCNQTSDAVESVFLGETPDPLPMRNRFTNPVGAPFYFVSRIDSQLTITSIRLVNVSTGLQIPLMPVRYMRNETYPGTALGLPISLYMDAAFVFPDVPLPYSSTLRMEFTATVHGKSITKSVTYRTIQNTAVLRRLDAGQPS